MPKESKTPLSFRAEPDVKGMIEKFLEKRHLGLTEIINTALFGFLKMEEKQQDQMILEFQKRPLKKRN